MFTRDAKRVHLPISIGDAPLWVISGHFEGVNVRFTPKSGHVRCNSRCLLWANSGHSDVSPAGVIRYTKNAVQRTKAMGVTLRATTFVITTRGHTIECCKREPSPRTRVRQTHRWCSTASASFGLPWFYPCGRYRYTAPATGHTVRTAMCMERTSGPATKDSGGVRIRSPAVVGTLKRSL